MSIRGQAAIVGYGELPTRRSYPGRTMWGLMAEASALAVADAGLRKEDIDGLVTEGLNVVPALQAEYLGMRPKFATGVTMMGASGAAGTLAAAQAVIDGLANYVLVVIGAGRDPGIADEGGVFGGRSITSEFEQAYGPAVAANNGYALMYQRHMYEYGTTAEQLARIAVNQRFNALESQNSVFRGQPITIDDVLNSRYTNTPLHLLECVMPCAGAHAVIVTTAERAKALPNPPVYILGGGIEQQALTLWQKERITVTPASGSARRAFAIAGYSPRDMEFAQFYDCYTILVAMSLEDAGFCKKGEIGPFFESVDTTYKGSFPVNTDGGQISGGQAGDAGGFRHVIEATRQIMGRAGVRQVAKNNLCMVNG